MTVTIDLPPLLERRLRKEAEARHLPLDALICETLLAHPDFIAEEEHELNAGAKKNFAQFLLDSPLPGSGVKFERSKDSPRFVEL